MFPYRSASPLGGGSLDASGAGGGMPMGAGGGGTGRLLPSGAEMAHPPPPPAAAAAALMVAAAAAAASGGFVPPVGIPPQVIPPPQVLPSVSIPTSRPASILPVSRFPAASQATTKDNKAVSSLSASEAASLGSVMAGGSDKKKRKQGGSAHLRKAAGVVWNDKSLDDWADGDFRIFCGDLGNEVTEEVLANAFRKYGSFQKAKVVRDKKSGKSKGYGFVSFEKPFDMLRALKEMNKKYVGNRPIRVMPSKWTDREISSDKNKEMTGILVTTKNNSRTLKKFKRAGKPVTGGRKYQEATERPAAPPRRGRGYYGPGGSARQTMGTTPAVAVVKLPTASPHLLANI